MAHTFGDLDQRVINTIRFLAIDAVERANSGHPGMPMGAAPMAYVLWDRFLRFNPQNPDWPNRDRFVLSAGHGSMLLYALLHLYGYDLSMEEIKNFRQLGSITPGHPEEHLTPGVETTTGPLGQGFANGVGMAMAERFLADHFNRDGFPIIDHYTYAICSDGDVMEGIAQEAASLAGHLQLGKLIYFYDDNDISIEGDTDITFTEDVPQRFEAYGWHVQTVEDGNDLEAIDAALEAARAETERPSLIVTYTHIGYGSPKQDTGEVHGSPLGADAVAETRAYFDWPEETFYIPDTVLEHTRRMLPDGADREGEWNDLFDNYRAEYPDLADEFERALRGNLPDGWDADLPTFTPDQGPMATRKASGTVLNAIAPHVPFLVGGSADLAGSNKTLMDGEDSFGPEQVGRNLHFGVREHAMVGISNGMSLGALRPYTGTFLIFSDYCRPSIRLAALMQAPLILIFTHDSIGLGEDGPTHQPVSQLLSLRAIPGLTVLRPADANETAAAWHVAMQHTDGPVALALTRQGLPILDVDPDAMAEGVPKGAYVLADADEETPDIVLIGTGSEVQLVVAARERLAQEGIQARTVSMPSWELFDAQPEDYRRTVLPPDVPKLAVEAGSPIGWHRYVGDRGDVIGLDRFGESAPGPEVFEARGFTVDRVVHHATRLAKQTETAGL
jgi:transketolase